MENVRRPLVLSFQKNLLDWMIVRGVQGVVHFDNFYDGEYAVLKKHVDKHKPGEEEAMENPNRPRTKPGWVPSGSTTKDGKVKYKGPCECCGAQCEVPFRPVLEGNPPQCRSCHLPPGEDIASA